MYASVIIDIKHSKSVIVEQFPWAGCLISFDCSSEWQK